VRGSSASRGAGGSASKLQLEPPDASQHTPDVERSLAVPRDRREEPSRAGVVGDQRRDHVPSVVPEQDGEEAYATEDVAMRLE
jgi:hypothetical protein